MKGIIQNCLQESAIKFVSTLLCAIAFLMVSIDLKAQDGPYPITNGTVTTCSSFLQDSGGPGGDYSNNEDFTFTICPEDPDSVVSINFGLFNLGAGDQMTIYNGSDASASPIGVFVGGEAQGQTFVSDPVSSTGCLTFHFESDGADVGNFSGEISCGYPCEPPVAVVETDQEAETLMVCVGEEIQFDGSNSTTAPGTVIEEYEWDWDDGTTTTTGGLVQTHAYDEPGDYKVNLFLTDDNDCTNNNLTQILVLVATIPSFEGTTDDQTICVGQEVNLEMTGVVEPITWEGIPDPEFGGTLYIPDDQSQCFENDLTFEGLIVGETVSSPSDIEDIFVNMEHSYIGDLTITIVCPNGQSMVLHDGNGGGTYVGEPVDGDDSAENPGVGYDYSWSSESSNGTWGEESTGVTTLPSDTYAAPGDWTNLVGCPLNGDWELVICDDFGADDGWVFDWTINFDPSLYPDIISFTPTFGVDCDSTFWSNNGDLVNESDDCNSITISPEEPGNYEYIYTATDNFGCTYYDTVMVEAVPSPPVSEFESGVSCIADYELGYAFDTTGYQSLGCPWQVQMNDAFNDGWNGNELEVYVNGTLEYTYTITAAQGGSNSESFYTQPTDQVEIYFDSGGFISQVSYTVTDPEGNLVVDVDQGDAAEGTVYNDVPNFVCTNPVFDIPFTVEWSPAGLFNNPNAQYGVANLVEGINDISVTLSFNDEPACPNTEEVQVTYGLEIGTSPDTTICVGGIAELSASPTNSQFDDVEYIWNNGEYTGQTIEVSGLTEPTTFEVYAEYAGGCQTETQSVTVDFYEPLAMAPLDTVMTCPGLSFGVSANEVTGGFGDYEYVWNYAGTEYAGDSISLESEEESPVCLTVTDACETPPIEDCVELIFEEPLDVQFEADTTQGCLPLEINFSVIPSNDLWTDATWEIEPSSVYTQESPSHVFEEPGVYDVGLTLISNLGCEYSNTYGNYITAFANPTAAFNATPQPTEIPDTEISFSDLSIGNIVEYQWVFDTLNVLGVSAEQNPIFEFPYDVGGTYPVTLTVTDVNNCIDDITRDIVINDLFNVFVPNAFTPNGDGVNDVWRVEGTDIDPNRFRLEIYNRWGQQVFVTEDVTEYWEGEHQNGNYYVPDGIYTWRLVAYSLATSNKKELSGTIHVLR